MIISEQAEGIRQISVGVGQIDDVTQNNTASAEQTAAASAELRNQAERLNGLVHNFRIRETYGHSDHTISAPALESFLEQGEQG